VGLLSRARFSVGLYLLFADSQHILAFHAADGQDKDSKPNLVQLLCASVTLALYTGALL
jgi:hypothetical protein